MQLTFHGHACVSLQLPHGGGTLVIDPGTFSDAASALTGAAAVLLTHDHVDHVDVPTLVSHLGAALDLHVWATGPAADALREGGAPAGRVHEVEPGQVLDVAGARVTVGGGDHALIHPEVPRAVNATYLVETGGTSVYHPGDSYVVPVAVPEGGLDVLLVPVSGPWMKLAEAIDFARAVPARAVVPVHDALLSEVGHTLTGRWLDTARLGGQYTYSRLAPGESLTV
ncbi:MBL fold metallo-hydrolase [Promicromonospora iranensis]|uniref:MBL fold metallo-hydrolase n=1 Tax=Promicromonospora iranensis TaxID=1105144 RepID=UPI0023A9E283|nr:MBL fold metallo-hydrolase [Promicromonospora iranensis]